MAAIALLKFIQGARVGGNGHALVVLPGVQVDISNGGDNTDVNSWRLELLDGPPGSPFEQVPGTPTLLAENPSSSTPAASSTPAVIAFPGSYRVRLQVWTGSNYTGVLDTDIRNYAVPTPLNSIIIPPFQKLPDPLPLLGSGVPGEKPNELNFEGQPFGWSGPNYAHPTYGQTYVQFRLLNAALQLLDAGGGGGGRFLDTYTGPGTYALPGNGDGTLTVLLVDSSGGPVQVDLPATLVDNEAFEVVDASGDAGTNNITVTGNGNTLNASGIISLAYGNKTFVGNTSFLGGGYFAG